MTGKHLYKRKPDYSRPLWRLPAEGRQDLLKHLSLLYGEDEAQRHLPELERLLQVHQAHKSEEMLEHEKRLNPLEQLCQRDMVLITYGDMITGGEGSPLSVLAQICDQELRAPNTIHILPFFPYSSDRGFAIIDFDQVDPKLGTWEDIRTMARRHKLMFDGVLNHVSAQSQAFQEFLNGNPRYIDQFIAYDSPEELTPDQRSKIFRPRVTDILTRFDTLRGPKYVWTTFSADQIDFNYRNPEVLLEVVDGLLFYVRNGADLLRLDAVTYIWAEPGTECVHLPETHEVVKLLRTVMDLASPGVTLITETNVPHQDNISYFGDGRDEAHMVYNFALPPMVLHAFYTQDASELARWAAGMEPPSATTAFFNILDTHDGIGLMGVKGILNPEQIGVIIDTARKNGALISYKTVETGGEEPYEINSTWWNAIIPASEGEEPGSLAEQVKRYAASRSIALALKGVPGQYLHGALGSENDLAAQRRSQHNRDVNRATVDIGALKQEMSKPDSKLSLLSQLLVPLNVARVTQRAFHPRGAQKVLETPGQVFGLLRTSPEGDQHLLALTNVSEKECVFPLDSAELGLEAAQWSDLLSDKVCRQEGGSLALRLEPYEVLWLRPSQELRQ
ncbi:sugar phosphorylase [Desulfocarbo indianensis]|nr:sugar phosphorylase [Desulfocarbo indianensis]